MTAFGKTGSRQPAVTERLLSPPSRGISAIGLTLPSSGPAYGGPLKSNVRPLPFDMNTNPYAPPNARVTDPEATDIEYAGFWIRVVAALIDTALIVAITYPLLISIYGWGFFSEERKSFIAGPAEFAISWLMPAAASIIFWLSKQATPGKMAMSAKVVDARTGNTLSVGQSIGRYLAYFICMLPLGLGILWVAFDARKQGWHDKLARTVVVRSRGRGTKPITFEKV